MRAFNVTVALDNSLRDVAGVLPPVEINLVGVSADEEATWQAKSMTAYFKPRDPLRDAADKGVLHLGENAPSKTFSVEDKLWVKWRNRGAVDLLILSDYPRSQPDCAGEGDPRRRILTLDECRWGDRYEIRVVLKKPGELTVLTPPEPAN